MNNLAERVITAHGGLDRWRRFGTLSADLEQGGALWPLKGQAGVLDRTRVTVRLDEQVASHHPFGDEDRRSRFAPDRVAIEDRDGVVLEELHRPRASFAGHALDTPWNRLQLAYFAGCAMWTYLVMPFLLVWPGVLSEEIASRNEDGRGIRRLRVRFPAHIATHSAEQTLHVGEDGLLLRHDYDVEIAGGTPGAHLIGDYADVSGIMIPTRRRIFPRSQDGTVLPEPLVVSIGLSNIVLGRRQSSVP